MHHVLYFRPLRSIAFQLVVLLLVWPAVLVLLKSGEVALYSCRGRLEKRKFNHYWLRSNLRLDKHAPARTQGRKPGMMCLWNGQRCILLRSFKLYQLIQMVRNKQEMPYLNVNRTSCVKTGLKPRKVLSWDWKGCTGSRISPHFA